ncbi:MAG: hypothetical protein RLZZ384_635 [Pseudomonadota bacterium]
MSVIKSSLVIAGVVFVTGCNTALLGTYGEDNQTFDAFKQRVEDVFQLQNSMTSAVMLLESEPSADILKDEAAMRGACASLNEAGSREMDGLDISLSLGKRIEKTVANCEKAAKLLQRRLEQVK